MMAVKNARHGRMRVLYAGDGAGTGRVACLESVGGECWMVEGRWSIFDGRYSIFDVVDKSIWSIWSDWSSVGVAQDGARLEL